VTKPARGAIIPESRFIISRYVNYLQSEEEEKGADSRLFEEKTVAGRPKNGSEAAGQRAEEAYGLE